MKRRRVYTIILCLAGVLFLACCFVYLFSPRSFTEIDKQLNGHGEEDYIQPGELFTVARTIRQFLSETGDPLPPDNKSIVAALRGHNSKKKDFIAHWVPSNLSSLGEICDISRAPLVIGRNGDDILVRSSTYDQMAIAHLSSDEIEIYQHSVRKELDKWFIQQLSKP